MTYRNVGFSKEEFQGFKEFFPYSKGANLLNRLLDKAHIGYMQRLCSLATGVEEFRFCQGAVDAIDALVGEIKLFMALEGDGAVVEDEGNELEEDDQFVDMNL